MGDVDIANLAVGLVVLVGGDPVVLEGVQVRGCQFVRLSGLVGVLGEVGLVQVVALHKP